MTIPELRKLANWHASRAERELTMAYEVLDDPTPGPVIGGIAEDFAKQCRTTAAFHFSAANGLNALAEAFEELCSGKRDTLTKIVCK